VNTDSSPLKLPVGTVIIFRAMFDLTMSNNSPKAVILMGVAGSGKTAVGKGVATRLNWLFLDADVFHPAANIEKMKQGIPLNDEDRTPWLLALRDELKASTRGGSLRDIGMLGAKRVLSAIAERRCVRNELCPSGC
jgi:cytidylate kinase